MSAAKRVILGLSLVVLGALPVATESIQLEELHGVYMVPVRINDAITIPVVLDSGAADISVPEDVFKTLIRTRTVTESDFLTPGTYVIADGSKHLEQRFVLHELRVGDQVVKDDIASVAPDKADPLLGQNFLKRLPAWTMDVEATAVGLAGQHRQNHGVQHNRHYHAAEQVAAMAVHQVPPGSRSIQPLPRHRRAL